MKFCSENVSVRFFHINRGFWVDFSIGIEVSISKETLFVTNNSGQEWNSNIIINKICEI